MLTSFLISSLLAVNVSTSNQATIKNNVQVRVNGEEAVMIRQQIKENIQERVQTHQELLLQNREQLRERLMALKDQRKQGIVENIYDHQNTINLKFTEKYNTSLLRLTEILTKLEAVGADAVLVTKAQLAIDQAQEAVDAQSALVYNIEITSETNLGTDVSLTVQTLRTDLQAVHKLVLAAKDAVILVNQSLTNE